MSDDATARRLLLRLDQDWDWPPPALLEEIIACGEAAVRPLEDLLTPELFAAAAESDKASSLAYYGLSLLGSLGTPAALPALVRAFPLVDEDTQEWMPDWIVPLGPDAIEPLFAVITDDAAGEYHRATASNIAVELAGDDPARRALVGGVLRGVVADYLARFDDLSEAQQMVVTFFSSDLVGMADPEARPMIEAALADDKIDEDFFDQEWLEECYAKGGQTHTFTRISWLERYREDYQKHKATEMFDALEEGEFVQEPVVLGKRLGRNDLCWCGSGKKYKKCHLMEDEKDGRDNRE